MMKFMSGLDSHLGCPRLPDEDLAAKLGAYELIGELPGAARSAATEQLNDVFTFYPILLEVSKREAAKQGF